MIFKMLDTEKILKKANVADYLKGTQIFVASHRGREDGFNENVFKYCKPEVIILSDKDIIHKTQEGQTQTYAGMVQGNGIILNGKTGQPRKVLTTRSDKHIWIRIEDNGARTYKTITE
jgi:ribosomal protein S4E